MGSIAADDSDARPLTQVERDLLTAMVSVDNLADSEIFIRQSGKALAASSCSCGCGSIRLIVDRATTRPAAGTHPAVVVEGDVLDDVGRVAGGVLLFQRAGWLSELEVYSSRREPLQLPPPSSAVLRLFSESNLMRSHTDHGASRNAGCD